MYLTTQSLLGAVRLRLRFPGMGETTTGWQLFAEADWAAARDAFQRALERDPGDPDALDGLGQSLWWLGERDAGIDRRRDAYAAYQRRGDARNAGRIADLPGR